MSLTELCLIANDFVLQCRKLLTAVATVGVGIQSIFFSNYDHVEGFEGKEHIFSHLQADMRDWIDRNVYNIDIGTKSNGTASSGTGSPGRNSNDVHTQEVAGGGQ